MATRTKAAKPKTNGQVEQPANEHDKLLANTLGQIEKAFGEGSIMKLSDPRHKAIEGISTGSLSLDLAASQRDLLREIDAALARIENGTYGICVELGKPIRIERLRETPWAKYSIEAARDRESSGRFYRPGNAQ